MIMTLFIILISIYLSIYHNTISEVVVAWTDGETYVNGWIGGGEWKKKFRKQKRWNKKDGTDAQQRCEWVERHEWINGQMWMGGCNGCE